MRKLTVLLDDHLDAWLRERARRREITLAEVIEELVRAVEAVEGERKGASAAATTAADDAEASRRMVGEGGPLATERVARGEVGAETEGERPSGRRVFAEVAPAPDVPPPAPVAPRAAPAAEELPERVLPAAAAAPTPAETSSAPADAAPPAPAAALRRAAEPMPRPASAIRAPEP